MEEIPEYRPLNRRTIYGSKNSVIYEDIQTTAQYETEKAGNTLRARQATHPERRDQYEAYFNQICHFNHNHIECD